MPASLSLQELLSLLYTERNLINDLFEKRNNRFWLSKQELLELVNEDSDRLHRLLQHNILSQSGNQIDLEGQLLSFFEKILSVDQEVNVAFIEDQVGRLQKAIIYFEDAHTSDARQAYVQQVKRILQVLSNTLFRSVRLLHRSVKYVYQAESNATIKRKKLEDYLQKQTKIDSLIQKLSYLFEHESLFKIHVGTELESLSLDLLDQMRIVRKRLVNIQQLIVGFLGKVRPENILLEKLQRLKYLKDQFELKEKTNLLQLLEEEHSLLFEAKLGFNPPLSLTLLESDQAYPSLQKVAKKKKIFFDPRSALSAKIDNSFLETQNQYVHLPDLHSIFNSFLNGKKDLFQFVMEEASLSELEVVEKVGIFFQMLSLFEEELRWMDGYEVWEGIEYVKVLPKSDS